MMYSDVETRNHPLAQQHPSCLIDLDTLLHREDNASTGIGCRFANSTVIDLDAAETEIARCESRGRASTMDCTFAIKNIDETHMLLVELRFNYQNLKNLNRRKLTDKVAGSQLLLGTTHQVHPQYVFVFKSNLKAEARNRINRMVPQIPHNYVVMDVEELEAEYFNP